MAFAVGGEGVQVEGAGSAGVMLLAVIAIALIVGCWATPAEGASKPGVAPVVAMATEPTAGGGAASAEGASCPDTAPATAIVTSFAGEGNGSAPSAPVDLAFGASFPGGGVSTTLCRWGLGKEDEGLQNRVVISIQQNNSIPL
jgi:hypothetical protein